MTAHTIARINRAIDGAVRASMRLSETVLMLAWITALVLLTQFLPYIPGLSG